MTSVTARIVDGAVPEDVHVAVAVFGGPDPEHRANLGRLVAEHDEAHELVARLADPGVDPYDDIVWTDDEPDRVSVFDHVTQEPTGFPTWWSDRDAIEVAQQLERQALAYRVAVRLRAERAAAATS